MQKQIIASPLTYSQLQFLIINEQINRLKSDSIHQPSQTLTTLLQMQHHHIDQAQIMQQNLHKLIKNQNYFSCFIQNTKQQQQPTNPFQKKLFDKNLRRSAISCGHYNSHQQNSTLQQSCRLTSSRRNSLIPNTQALLYQNQPNLSCQNPSILSYQNPSTLSQSNLYTQLISQPRIQTAQKVSLAHSRHSDPIKQQITQIINNFRLQLDYLEQKLHQKVCQLNNRYGDRECNQKDREGQFMIDSLQKIVGFMVENCVNLEDSVMYGERNEEETGRNSEMMRKQVYQIEEDQNEGNMSFSRHNIVDNFKPTHRFDNKNPNPKDKASVKKRKIVGMIEKENMNSNNTNNNQEKQNMPQTYFVNSKLHCNNQASTKTSNQPSKTSKKTTRSLNQHCHKGTKRAISKSSNQKVTQNNTQNEFHYHSTKQTVPNQSQYNSNSQNESNYGVKSIYETVLQEREMRLKMKKKMV